MHVSWQRNLGNVDRGLRIIAGLLLVYQVIFQAIAVNSNMNIGLGLSGMIMLAEGLLAY